MPANPDIRLASKNDAGWIAQLSKRFIEHGLRWNYDGQRIRRAVAHPDVNVVVAHGGRVPLGFGIMEYGDEIAHLVLLGVQPVHQGRGLGRALVEWLEQPAVVAGIRCVRVEVRADNPGGIAFYEKLGYGERARVAGYYEGRVDALRLEKELRVGVD